MALTAIVDLTTGKISQEETDPRLLKKWLGGRGYAAALLDQRVNIDTDPFSPENCLIFSTGRLNATPWPTASRYHVTFKSPATGAYGYANAGGHMGPELRNAGYDAIVVTGKASEPVILQVTQHAIQIINAGELWGADTYQVEEVLKASGGGRVAVIGPAGEHQVHFAAIINDNGRAAARSGPGAVMGSKNLKALHVIAGQKPPASPLEFLKVVKKHSKNLISHHNTQGLRDESTLFLMSIKNVIGDLPARNHQTAQVPFITRVNAKSLGNYFQERKGCAVCPIRCSRSSAVLEGPYAARIEGPEYETADALGPLVWNSDPELIIKANEQCNKLGMDTISTGVSIAFAMECHEHGLLNDEELSLEWGDPATILGLIKKIAYREGIGDLLADGVRQAASKIGHGADYFAMQVKGVEMPRQEPRIAKSFGLGHATGNRGADHLYALPTIDLAGNWDVARKLFPESILPVLMDLADETYKADVVVYGEHFCAIADSLGLCKFSTAETYLVMPDDIAEGLTLLGYPYTGKELITAGERIVNLERLFNIRHGFSRKDDRLPLRFSQEPLEVFSYQSADDGSGMIRSEKPVTSGLVHDFEAMLDRYYQLRGWNEDGKPTAETLKRLEIND